MNSILENELVKKYFGCEHFDKLHSLMMCRAYNVIQAMHEKVEKSDICITSLFDGECRVDSGYENSYFHPWLLKVPTRFQTAPERCEHRHELGGCHKILGCPPNAWDGDKQPPPAEAKAECDCGCHGKDCTNEGKYGQACCPKDSPAKPTESPDDDTCTKCGMFHIPAGSPGTPPAPALSLDQGIDRIAREWDSRKAHGCLKDELRSLCALVMREAQK